MISKPAGRATEGKWQADHEKSRDQFKGLQPTSRADLFSGDNPRVPLRSTLGFMLSLSAGWSCSFSEL
jgi:hypothetical protein